MARRPSRRVAPIVTEQPLSERVDKAGLRQLRDPAAARASREAGRIAAAEEGEAGWWYHDGAGSWEYYGND